MKKRIVGLLMALCLIVGLLPMTVLAEEAAGPLKKVAFTTKAGTVKETQGDTEVVVEDKAKVFTENLTAPVYGKTSADGLTIDWEKATASDYNIAINQSATGLEVVLKDAYFKVTGGHLNAIVVEYEGAVTIKLIGKNVIETTYANSPACLHLRATSTTITGGGSLTATSQGYSTSHPAYEFGSTIDCNGDLTIKDVTLNLNQIASGEPYTEHTIRCSGNVVIDDATVNMYAQFACGIYLGTNRNTLDKTGKTITIKNGAKVIVDSRSWCFCVGNTGVINIDAANGTDVILKSNYVGVFNYNPVLENIGNINVVAGMATDGTDAKPYTGEAKK